MRLFLIMPSLMVFLASAQSASFPVAPVNPDRQDCIDLRAAYNRMSNTLRREASGVETECYSQHEANGNAWFIGCISRRDAIIRQRLDAEAAGDEAVRQCWAAITAKEREKREDFANTEQELQEFADRIAGIPLDRAIGELDAAAKNASPGYRNYRHISETVRTTVDTIEALATYSGRIGLATDIAIARSGLDPIRQESLTLARGLTYNVIEAALADLDNSLARFDNAVGIAAAYATIQRSASFRNTALAEADPVLGTTSRSFTPGSIEHETRSRALSAAAVQAGIDTELASSDEVSIVRPPDQRTIPVPPPVQQPPAPALQQSDLDAAANVGNVSGGTDKGGDDNFPLASLRSEDLALLRRAFGVEPPVWLKSIPRRAGIRFWWFTEKGTSAAVCARAEALLEFARYALDEGIEPGYDFSTTDTAGIPVFHCSSLTCFEEGGHVREYCS